MTRPYTYFEVGAREMGVNPFVFDLPFTEFFTNVRGTPEGLGGQDVPWDLLDSIINLNGDNTTRGFLHDLPADGFGGSRSTSGRTRGWRSFWRMMCPGSQIGSRG